jgi:hypothetical protein
VRTTLAYQIKRGDDQQIQQPDMEATNNTRRRFPISCGLLLRQNQRPCGETSSAASRKGQTWKSNLPHGEAAMSHANIFSFQVKPRSKKKAPPLTNSKQLSLFVTEKTLLGFSLDLK